MSEITKFTPHPPTPHAVDAAFITPPEVAEVAATATRPERRNMTREEAARELAKAARNALDDGGDGVAFAEACMMGISVLMRRVIHTKRNKAVRAARRAAEMAAQ